MRVLVSSVGTRGDVQPAIALAMAQSVGIEMRAPRAGAAPNDNRARLGLAPIDDVLRHILGERPWLAADATLAPSTAVQTGAWLLESATPLPDVLERFLRAGEPPVYVGMRSRSTTSITRRSFRVSRRSFITAAQAPRRRPRARAFLRSSRRCSAISSTGARASELGIGRRAPLASLAEALSASLTMVERARMLAPSTRIDGALPPPSCVRETLGCDRLISPREIADRGPVHLTIPKTSSSGTIRGST